MGAPKRLEKPIYVTTILEESQHEALKLIAYKKRKAMAELIREALERYIGFETASQKRKKSA